MRTNKREVNRLETHLDRSVHEMCHCAGPTPCSRRPPARDPLLAATAPDPLLRRPKKFV